MDAGNRRATRLSMHRLHHSGVRPVRVLLIGDRAHLLEAVGGTTAAQRAADRMWLATRRGVDLDVLGDLAPVLRAVKGVFRTWRLWRYDVVLVAVDGTDAGAGPRTLHRVGDLVGEVLADAAGATEVVVLGAPPTGRRRSRHATPPEDRLRAAVEQARSARVRFRAVDVVGDEAARSRGWAAALGEEVARSVARLDTADPSDTAASIRNRPDDEPARQRALDDVRATDVHHGRWLDDLVELARTAFGTESAEINFIDRDRQLKIAVAGGDPTSDIRAHSFCSLTITRSEPTVVADARLDPLLRFSPLTSGPHPIRFYAAHPIESTEGYRIGSFCVYDSEPRDVRGLDLAVLRDLALLAQAELMRSDEPPAGASPAVVRGARAG